MDYTVGTMMIMGIVLGGGLLVLVGRRMSRAHTADRARTRANWATDRNAVNWSFGAHAYWGQLALRPELFDLAVTRLLSRPVAYSILGEEPILLPAETACTVEDQGVVSTPEESPNPVFFKDGEPTTLATYEGQDHITSYLQAIISGAPDYELNTRAHQLFTGPPGLGKTLLERAWVNSWNERNAKLGHEPVRFFEVFPADLPDVKALDRVVRAASKQPSVLFIDEIHDLTERHTLKLYMLMEDGRYKFEDESSPMQLEYIRIDGATTDYGAMHPALKRRFNRHMLEPMPMERIRSIVQKRSFPIEESACEALVARTHFAGAPWEALQLHGQASAFARARKATQIELEDVQRVFTSQRIDELGLRWMDRKVIEVLLRMPRYRNQKGTGQEFVCFAASESDLCTLSGIDRGEYRESVKPRLMARGLLVVRATYGQSLTASAPRVYEGLVKTVPK